MIEHLVFAATENRPGVGKVQCLGEYHGLSDQEAKVLGEVMVVKIEVCELFLRGMVDWKATGDVHASGVSVVEIASHVFV